MKIILIGFMGAGKSSVAKVLAEKLKLRLVELDDLVLERSGRKSISEIFEKEGEGAFRQMEVEVASSLSGMDDVVISAGGGVVENKICMEYLGKNGIVIFLDTSFEKIETRLAGDNSRPLFKDKEKAKGLYELRKGLYEEYADMMVSTDDRSVGEVVYEIIKKLKSKK